MGRTEGPCFLLSSLALASRECLRRDKFKNNILEDSDDTMLIGPAEGEVEEEAGEGLWAGNPPEDVAESEACTAFISSCDASTTEREVMFALEIKVYRSEK